MKLPQKLVDKLLGKSTPKKKMAKGLMMTKNHGAFVTIFLFCRKSSFPLPIEDYPFAKESYKRKWEFDCCWPEYKLAIEFMGGLNIKGGGAHNSPRGYTDDCEKISHAAILGWSVMPVTLGQLKKGLVFNWLEQWFQQRGIYAKS